MTILRSGATPKYSENWENVFGKKRAVKKKSPSKKKKNTTRSKKR